MCLRFLMPLAAIPRRRPPLMSRMVIVLLVNVGVALVVLSSARPAWSDEFVLIRNARNPSSSVTPAQAREMAIGKRKVWPQGAVVNLVLTQMGSPELVWFAASVCGVKEVALMSKIKQEVFKGELRKPVIAASDRDVVNAVAADEGAFGVVTAEVGRSLPATVAVLALR
jgi:hypothetical protein